jgi:D-lactate dehydrogenase
MKLVYIVHEEGEEQIVRESLQGWDVVFANGALHEQTAISDSDAEALSVFVNSKVDAAVLDRFPKLKFIATRSTGFDHIDLAETTKRGIMVSSVPRYGVETVGEFAFALLLSLTRHISKAHARVRGEGSFSQDGLRGVDLAGKTIGIIGMGSIGAHAAKIAKGFGMNVVAYDPFVRQDLANQIGFAYLSLDELLSRADMISIHALLTPETKHMINRVAFSKMKKGVYIVNTARGGLIDSTALVEALENGTVAGAALDVIEGEDAMFSEERLLAQEHPDLERLRSALSGHMLAKHPRVILTPHIAFNSAEAVRRIIDTSIENLKAFAENKPQNVVKGT